MLVSDLATGFFFFKQKTAYEMRISDWSSDVCSSDLSRQERRLGRICRKAFCMGRRKTGDKRYPRLSLCARRTKSCRCAPPSFPAEEQVRAHRSHLVQAAAPIRHDPVGMVMGGVSDGTEYSSRERCARNAA